MKAFLFLCLFSVVCLSESKQPLFLIQRSLNANEVHYDLNLNGLEVNEKDPLDVYWVLKAKDGSREELKGIEKRRAYGFKVVRIDRSSFEFSLVPLKKDIISVRRNGDKFFAVMLINGSEALLESVYITTGKGGPLPKVTSIEIRGRDLKSGQAVTELRKF